MTLYLFMIIFVYWGVYLQYYDIVGWATGRASGL